MVNSALFNVEGGHRAVIFDRYNRVQFVIKLQDFIAYFPGSRASRRRWLERALTS